MRGTVAKRLRRRTRELVEAGGGQGRARGLRGMLVRRGAANLMRQHHARERAIRGLMGRGTTRKLAEALVPEVGGEAVIAVAVGPRATYLRLKAEYKRRRR